MNRFYIFFFSLFFFVTKNLLSVQDPMKNPELLDVISQLVDASEAGNDASDAEFNKIIKSSLPDALKLVNAHQDSALAFAGQFLNLETESYKYGLATSLFLYCFQNRKNAEAQKLSKAAALELYYKNSNVVEPVSLLATDADRTAFKVNSSLNLPNPGEMDSFSQTMTEAMKILNYKTAGLALDENNILYLAETNPDKLSSFLQAKTISVIKIINQLLNNYDEVVKYKNDQRLIIQWAVIDTLGTISRIITLFITPLYKVDARRAMPLIDKLQKLGIYISGLELKNENAFLKTLLGISALGGAAFLIAYALGYYKPSPALMQRLQQLPTWGKIQAISRTLFTQWKTMGLSLALMKGLWLLQNYYKNTIVPYLQMSPKRRAQRGPRIA